MKLFGINFSLSGSKETKPELESVSTDDLNPYGYAGQTARAGYQSSIWDGEKFFGGLGPQQLLSLDYSAMRRRSVELFTTNPYARGLVRRLVTNEVNIGLNPESCPDADILGLSQDFIADWTENVENRFNIWGNNKKLCCALGEKTLAQIQYDCRLQAIISGDVLVMLEQDSETNLPSIRLIDGSHVVNPYSNKFKMPKTHTMKQGVQRDGKGRVFAYHVRQKDGSTKQIRAFGAKTGRPLSWLVFGNERMLDDERGQPLLAIILQSLKEIDRYRDSAQRAAVVNSVLAMFITKSEDKLSSLPLQGGALRKDQVTVNGDVPSAGSTEKTIDVLSGIPGVVAQELQVGERPETIQGDGTDTNFPVFEKAMLRAIAWSNQIPPEILELAFTNNYSASQAAINEFKIYLNLVWFQMGTNLCQPIFQEWLISEVLNRRITAKGLLESWRNPLQYDTFGAWMQCEWYGSVKPSTDMLKSANGSAKLVENGWSTNARETRGLTGMKFSKNIKRVKRENEMKAEAMRPLLEIQHEFSKYLNDNEPKPETTPVNDKTKKALDECKIGDEDELVT